MGLKSLGGEVQADFFVEKDVEGNDAFVDNKAPEFSLLFREGKDSIHITFDRVLSATESATLMRILKAREEREHQEMIFGRIGRFCDE
jgi:hypothetical protein